MHEEPTARYHCPGEKGPISRAIHLGRLARFYPACRACVHRRDTAGLSPRHVKRLAETQRRAERRPLFDAEGVAGVYLNDLTPGLTKRIAAALGICLGHEALRAGGAPSVVLGGDGRPITPEIVAAVGEGLRWAGCQVIDVGPASAGCLAFAVNDLRAAGGVLVGNPGNQVQTVGLKFWGRGARPLSAGGGLDEVRSVFESGIDRPTRRFGSLRRYQADLPYLAHLMEHYHALRPLRFVLNTNCLPVAGYLERLTRAVACQIFPCRTTPERIPERIRTHRAHFGVQVDDDGERLALWDERGRPLGQEQLLALIAGHLLADEPEAAIVVERETSLPCVARLAALGGRVVTSDARRSEMARAMHEHGVRLGGGPSGRLWYAQQASAESCAANEPVFPSADALQTLTYLLVLLSQSDRPLSGVLDAAGPAG